jgi:HPt (histidine-containing phosphotransfer) domain-containing protein
MITSGEPDSVADLDEFTLHQTCDGDEEFERELLGTFLNCQETAMTDLARACELGEFDTIKKIAHFTKGGARSIGGLRLAAYADALEEAAGECNGSSTSQIAAEIQVAYSRLRSIIQSR